MTRSSSNGSRKPEVQGVNLDASKVLPSSRSSRGETRILSHSQLRDVAIRCNTAKATQHTRGIFDTHLLPVGNRGAKGGLSSAEDGFCPLHHPRMGSETHRPRRDGRVGAVFQTINANLTCKVNAFWFLADGRGRWGESDWVNGVGAVGECCSRTTALTSEGKT